MPVSVNCQCGKFYNLKDEFAGKTLKCSNCGAKLLITPHRPDHAPVNRPVLSDSVFDRDKFLLRQKILTISEKYDVCDEQGNPILYIERPAHLLRNLGAIFAGITSGIVVIILISMLAAAIPNEDLKVLLFLFAMLVGIVTMLVVSILLYKKRHVTIYRNKTKQEALLKVLQDKKFELITATFTLRDSNGDLALFRKNYLYDIFRKQWYCYNPNGSLICIAKEDSIILALLRRFLGTFFGLLRTNFIIVQGDSDRVIGEFNRNFTLLDRYVLDMSADSDYILDRRIAIALGVMLDTGERR